MIEFIGMVFSYFFLECPLPGSDTEKRDIKKAYLGGAGCINYMLNSVPFMDVEDEPRIMEIVKGTISQTNPIRVRPPNKF